MTEFQLNMNNISQQVTSILLSCLSHEKVVDILTSRNNFGMSFFHLACFYGYYDTVKEMINILPVEKCNVKDYQQATPLHLACFNNHFDIVKLLLEKGVKVYSCAYKIIVKKLRELCFENERYVRLQQLEPENTDIAINVIISRINHREMRDGLLKGELCLKNCDVASKYRTYTVLNLKC